MPLKGRAQVSAWYGASEPHLSTHRRTCSVWMGRRSWAAGAGGGDQPASAHEHERQGPVVAVGRFRSPAPVGLATVQQV